MYNEILCNMKNLNRAYRLAHRSKSDYAYTVDYDTSKLYNLTRLLHRLQKKEWDKIFTYYRFIIHLPKERIVDAMEFDGRIVQHVLCDNILEPYFEKRLVKENCACRVGKGTDYALNLIKQGTVKFLKTHSDGYVLKMDVKKYFPSVDRTVLKEMLSKFPDREILELLYYIIDRSPDRNGLPIGNQTSQWFALYYLDRIDRIIKEKYRIKFYARYMDDLIIIHEDKEYLKRLWAELAEYADKRLKLQFNGKTQITPLHKGFTFLGWRLFPTETKKIICKIERGKRKMRRATIAEARAKYLNGEIDALTYNDCAVSLSSHLKRGNTYGFRQRNEIDGWCPEVRITEGDNAD